MLFTMELHFLCSKLYQITSLLCLFHQLKRVLATAVCLSSQKDLSMQHLCLLTELAVISFLAGETLICQPEGSKMESHVITPYWSLYP